MKRSTAILLFFAIVALLVVNSADFFFHTPFYETWDSAANALSVDRAKHFAQLYGPYSRWGFYHPGPALFYVQALGEWLFFDTLRLTPAPYNAQTLLYLFVSVGFFVASLRVFSRWLPAGRWRWWFVCAALGVAVLHFTAANHLHSYDPVLGPNAFFSLWSAHALVLPFLCLLVAGASVAAGGGQDLPLLALADGYLLQTHVAQPLFVLPLTALALAALTWRSAGQEKDSIGFEPSRRRRAALWLSAGWRAFRREHVLAAIILGFFALPVLIDLNSGSQSNMAAILEHLRKHQGENKTWLRSVDYFLQFGAYAPYQPDTIEFAVFTPQGMTAYLRAHWFLFGLWTAALLLAGWALSGAVRPPGSGADEPDATRALRGIRPLRQRFLAWAAAFLLAAIVLTLKWGTIQDGNMFYYNAWFNFAIYYFGALIALAVVCDWMLSPGETRTVAAMARPSGRDRLVGLAVLALVCFFLARQMRVRDADPGSTVAFHESVARALAATAMPGGGPPTPRILRFPLGVWVTVAGVALQMERAAQPFYVSDDWQVYFGREHAWGAAPPDLIHQRGLQAWRFEYLPPEVAPAALAGDGGKDVLHIVTPALDHQSCGLGDYLYSRFSVPAINPDTPAGARLDFESGHNTLEFGVAGWGDAEATGTWSNGHHPVVEFRTAPLPEGAEGVDLSFLHAVPFTVPPKRPYQRLSLFFNGEPLSDERTLNQPSESLTYRVPAELWNRASAAPRTGKVTLELDLPDAITPEEAYPEGTSQDTRVLGLNVRGIQFQAVAAPPAPPAPAQN